MFCITYPVLCILFYMAGVAFLLPSTHPCSSSLPHPLVLHNSMHPFMWAYLFPSHPYIYSLKSSFRFPNTPLRLRGEGPGVRGVMGLTLFQCANRVFYCRFNTLVTNRNQCNKQYYKGSHSKYCPANMYAVSKVLQPYMHYIPGNRRCNN